MCAAPDDRSGGKRGLAVLRGPPAPATYLFTFGVVGGYSRRPYQARVGWLDGPAAGLPPRPRTRLADAAS